MRKGWLAGTAAFAIYGVLAILLLFWPKHPDLQHAVLAGQLTDTSVILWSLAWWPWAISHGINPLMTHVLWAPVGQNVVWCTSMPTLALLFWPITECWGPIVSYNVIALLSPALTAWSAYLLAREITKKQFFPSLFAGGLFGFSSYEFGELIAGHLFLIATWTLPLLVWVYLLRRRGKLSRWSYLILLGVLLLFQFGLSTEIFATAVLFGLLAVVVDVTYQAGPMDWRQRYQPLVETLIALALTTVALSPLLYYIFFKGYIRGPLNPPDVYYTDPLNYFIPTRLTALGSKLLAPVSSTFSGNLTEQLAYLGAPLILMILLFIREFVSQAAARIMIFILAVTVVASLGAHLAIMRYTTPVVLPWLLFVHWLLLDNALPSRFPLYATLVAAAICAWWLASSTTRRFNKILLSGFSILFLIPRVDTGFWDYPVHIPPFFITPACHKYLKPGANVVIFPYGFQGASMLWQAEAHFYFSMAGGYLNMPAATPVRFRHSPVVAAFYGYGIPPNYPILLKKFIRQNRIAAMIIPIQFQGQYAALVAPLHIHPIQIGGVALYLLPPPQNHVLVPSIAEKYRGHAGTGRQ